MEMQVCQYDPPTMADRTIKIERDDTEGESCENSGTDIPCVSTVPIPADKNTGSYYYPSQAVVAPRTPVFTTVSKMAQKRKTIQGLVQAALMNVEEPILFEETICCNNVKIVLIDNKTKQIIPREHLREEDNTTNTTPQTSQATDFATAVSTTSVTRDTAGQPLRIGKSYSLRHKTGSTATQPEEIATSSASNSVTSSYNPTNFTPNTTSIASISSTVAATTVTTRPGQNQPARPETLSTTTTLRPRTSLLNSLPSERTEPPKSLSSKLPLNQTAYKPLAASPSASVRSETVTNSKMAICFPNTASKTEISLTRAVYVPKEINLGATELRLEDCINVKDICDKELTKWTAEDVAKFVRATDCSEYAHVFVDQEIDGKALTLLNQDFLIQWMKLKLGPAMKLNCHIINLKHSLNTS